MSYPTQADSTGNLELGNKFNNNPTVCENEFVVELLQATMPLWLQLAIA